MVASSTVLKCSLLWKLCRKHGWGAPIPKDELVDLALKRSDQGQGRQIVEELLQEPYVEHRRGSGYRIKNNPEAQALLACRLKYCCEYVEIQIEPTLSRFEQAGGFDAYDEDELLARLEEWDS